MRRAARRALAAVLLAGAAAAPPLAAQSGTHALAFRDVPVGVALEELVSLTGISLVYGSDVVRDRTTVCRAENATPEELLRCITRGAGLDYYRLSSGTYVVIEAPEALPAFGTVSGQIVDALTGEPVPFASVELADGTRGAETNAAGIFLLPGLLPGPQQLVVRHVGYLPVQFPLEVLAAGNVRRQIRLDPAVLELDPILVEGLRDVGGGELSAAGWRGDGFAEAVPLGGEVSQQARSGLGVSRRPLFADLSIQGSSPGEHSVRLDGVPVFDPVSLGRSRSAFSPLALRRINVRKAGFGVEHGSFTGGVVDVEHALSDRAGPGGMTALADPYSVNGDISLPLALGPASGALMVAGRTSVWGIFREPSLDQALQDWNAMDPVLMEELSRTSISVSETPDYGSHGHGSDVGFTDFHGALRLEFPGFRTLQASFYRGTNAVETELLSSGVDRDQNSPPLLLLTRDRYGWSNTAGQVRLDLLVGDRASMQLRGWGSRHELDHDYAMVETEASPEDLVSGSSPALAELRSLMALRPPSEDRNQIQEWGAGLRGDLAAGGGHFLTGGVEVVRVQSRAFLQNGFLRPLLFQDLGWRFAAFVQDRWRVTSRVSVEGGTRVTSIRGGGTYAEPRVAVRVDGSGTVTGPWSARLSAGVYRQYLDQFGLANVGPSALVPEVQFWLPSDGSMEPSSARHLALELAALPWNGWEIRGEAYYKALDRILALDYATLALAGSGEMTEMEQSDFVGTADGVAYGAGVRVGWERGRAQAQVAYDWSVSERSFPSRFDGDRQPTPWSEPHRVALRTRLPVAFGVAAEVESRSVWGRTWGLRRAYYDFLALHQSASGLPIGRPEEDRLPALHQVDLGLSWLGEVAGSLAEVRAEVRNALFGRQVLDYSLVRATTPGGEDEFQRRGRLLPGAALIITARIGL